MSREVFYTAGDVARVLGWTLNRTKRWMVDKGIDRQTETGRWYTTRSLVRTAWPEDADYIMSAIID